MNSLFFVLFKGKLKKIRQSRVIDEEIEIIEEENNGEEQDMDRFKQAVIEEEVSKIPVLSRSNVLFQTFQGRYLLSPIKRKNISKSKESRGMNI